MLLAKSNIQYYDRKLNSQIFDMCGNFIEFCLFI